ncbi:MAG: hypothetical protein AAFR41_12075 [Pseudomonadota bacterium]
MADGLAMRLSQVGKAAKGPTPLLSFLAGPHAEQVAACWPAPHDRFFALPAARRHVAVILLARGERDLDALARAVERHKDADLARKIMSGGDVPAGLMKAMGRLGETQWRLEDYELFLDLFRDVQANPVLRHMSAIGPEQLSLIGALPTGLRDARIVSLTPGLAAARDLGIAFDLAQMIKGDGSAPRLIARWARAKDTQKLFTMAIEDLQPERFTRSTAIPQLPAVFEPVVTRKQLEKVALEFQNCLRDFAHDLALGKMAVFIWRVAPAVALALRWDAAGWRLAEAELAANTDVDEAQLRELVAVLTKLGIRTGPGLGVLSGRLGRHPHGQVDDVGDTFHDRLELGDLWD